MEREDDKYLQSRHDNNFAIKSYYSLQHLLCTWKDDKFVNWVFKSDIIAN